MLKDTLVQFEKSIYKIEDKEKKNLLKLLDQLKKEVNEISETHKQLEVSLEGLSTSLQDFEATHPKLATTVSELCNLLARIGI